MKDFEKFKELLESQHDFPGHYKFKFIVPSDLVGEFEKFFEEAEELKFRPSKKGNYVSITAVMKMDSSHEVVTIYKKATYYEGVISL